MTMGGVGPHELSISLIRAEAEWGSKKYLYMGHVIPCSFERDKIEDGNFFLLELYACSAALFERRIG